MDRTVADAKAGRGVPGAVPVAEPAARLRQVDPDRFLCALFAPARCRDAVVTLCLLHHELERAVFGSPGQSAHGPVAAMIRLGWWREVLAGEREDWRGHPLAVAVRDLLAADPALSATASAMVVAYEDALDGIDAPAAWQAFARHGPGGLQRLIGGVCGGSGAVLDRAAAAGMAFAAARRIAVGGDDWTAEGWRALRGAAGPLPPRAERVALLPAVLAMRDLRRAGGPAPQRGLGDRLAVAWTALRPGGRLEVTSPKVEA